MASAHVAAAPHGGRRKVKGALGIRFSKSNGGEQERPLTFQAKKLRGLQPDFLNFYEIFQLSKDLANSLADGLLRNPINDR